MVQKIPLTDEEKSTYEWQMWVPDFGEEAMSISPHGYDKPYMTAVINGNMKCWYLCTRKCHPKTIPSGTPKAERRKALFLITENPEYRRAMTR